MITDFERRHGFAPPPTAHIEGTWEAFFMRVEAKLKCKSCGAEIMLTLRNGDPTRMTEKAIGQRVIRVALARHECPAVAAELAAHKERYYQDLRRGMEKKHEADYKRSRRGS